MYFTVLADHGMKIKENEKINQYLRAEKALKYEDDNDTNCSWCPWNYSQDMEKILGELKVRAGIETIQISALLKPTRILKRLLKT